MLSIWKYGVEPAAAKQILMVPKEAEILSCGMDAYGVPSIWVLLDTDAPAVPREYYVVGTGWDLSFMDDCTSALMFIGTIKDGPYMWHVFVGDES